MSYGLSYSAQPAIGFVYVMECGGYYKIGWSQSDPSKRQRHMQIGNPLPITIVGVIEGSQFIESDWHDAFEDKRVHGEWFALTVEDVARILHEDIGVDLVPDDDWIA